LSYDDAVEEAICFGWIDSVIRRIDDETYGQRFTPRGPKSSWSATNIRRAEKMIREGGMTEPGSRDSGEPRRGCGRPPCRGSP